MRRLHEGTFYECAATAAVIDPSYMYLDQGDDSFVPVTSPLLGLPAPTNGEWWRPCAEPTVVAFLARAGTGKTTAANYLVAEYGAVKVSFAGPLKELARRLMDYSDAQLFGDQKEKVGRGGITPRHFLQTLGNESRKLIGDTVWIDAAYKAVSAHPGKLVVIDDCRYPNEVDAVHSRGGTVVKLEASDRASTADPNHPSELGVDEASQAYIRHTIDNQHAWGTAPLFARLDGIVHHLQND